MRTDCRHYFRRTGAAGEVTEQCDVGAAPDAPLRCPDACPRFEARKLSTIGFDYGSLDAARSAGSDAPEHESGDDVDALFAQLRDAVDEVADSVVADDAERRRAEAVRQQRRRRRRIR